MKTSHSVVNRDLEAPRLKGNLSFLAVLVFSLSLFLFSYANHFTNSFHFDDIHTIQKNSAIKEITPLRFFTDGSTFSSLPSNQSYRPFITLENAIDYKTGGLNPVVFHIHIFCVLLLLCFLLWVFVKKMLDILNFSGLNHYVALMVTGMFGLLCANAETVNYIIQRAEIDAALFIIAGFVAFLHGGIWRTKLLYLIFPFIGFFAKEMAFVFAPLLFLYLLIFEEKTDLLHIYKAQEFKKSLRALRKAFPAIALTAAFLIFYSRMLPASFNSGGSKLLMNDVRF